ncbi:pentapeptide repeat-containing protein [Frankia sp. AiPs1]|uniref:pentapeptide repeat-containing protein n=1 Tax=Frankia sp. AiPs1 TaxID=573493 RepID=UPI002044978F|nr:pentapeptide repeat-containing protein [Frankia sp. AiPs1]MCM3922539.1 pentapeptide repeat-containing protein [Frankia sp. AiPs1]
MVDRAALRRLDRRWLWVVAAAAAIGAAVGIWHLTDRMYPPGTDGAAEARASLQGGILTAVAALIAVAGGLIALGETRQANKNTHVRELYTRAIDQLGSDRDTIRLGGIYALERIVTDSPVDQRTVVEVLSAFVRKLSTSPLLRTPLPPGPDGTVAPLPPAIDIRAAVQVLARLPHRRAVPRADLTGADLTGPASLTDLALPDADLTGARLSEANLTRAQLDGANLSRALLVRATLARAFLVEANLAEARLAEADLTGAELFATNLTGAQLTGADLTEARLVDAKLAGAQLGGATLTGTLLFGVDLTGVSGLTQKQVNAARGDERTRLPAGIQPPPSWVAPPQAGGADPVG